MGRLKVSLEFKFDGLSHRPNLQPLVQKKAKLELHHLPKGLQIVRFLASPTNYHLAVRNRGLFGFVTLFGRHNNSKHQKLSLG